MRELTEIEFDEVTGGCPCDPPNSGNIGCCCFADPVYATSVHYELHDLTQSYFNTADGASCMLGMLNP